VEVSKFFAEWHPLLVHFPIALLFFAVCLDLFALITKDERAAWAGQVATVAGTMGLMLAFITGNYAEIVAAHQQIRQKPIGDHEAWATATSWTFILLTAWRSYLKPGSPRMKFYLVAAIATLGCLTVTGYKGGRLVYDHAAAVHVATQALPIPATPEDLANLRLENGPEELAYSGMMHHVFGWLTLGLALWQAYHQLNLPGQDRVRALGPIMLTGGGIFLMIFSDWNAWPMGNDLPITDPEVLFHKVLATIMIFFGIGMNLARRRPKGEASSLQSHLLAILALVGGGMLFTHVHTGAPFSHTAMGVYVQHFAVGCLALACGGVKMLETVLPHRKKLWDRCWILLLVIIAINLIWYVEGFPWYIHDQT
jgi:uncharacterized membrane protein